MKYLEILRITLLNAFGHPVQKDNGHGHWKTTFSITDRFAINERFDSLILIQQSDL